MGDMSERIQAAGQSGGTVNISACDQLRAQVQLVVVAVGLPEWKLAVGSGEGGEDDIHRVPCEAGEEGLHK